MPARKEPTKVINVLLVEDSPTQVELLRHLLERKGYRVCVAKDGKQALAALGDYKPALVISDIKMPEINGYELCKHIKADENTRDIPVILLTALSEPQDILEGLACGADNFITKPFSEEYLLAHVEQILANREIRQVENVRVGMEFIFAGKKHFVSAASQQILGLLLSTYEAAEQRNNELTSAREELRLVNEHLEDLVKEKTAALSAEIVERKRAEATLREERDKLTKIAATVPGVLCSFRLRPDCSAHMPYASPALQDIIGFKPEDLAQDAAAMFALIHPDDAEPNRKAINESARTLSPWRNEFRYNHPQKGEIWIEGHSMPQREADGSTIWHGFITDITARKRAEDKLRFSEERYRTLAETAPVMIFMIDRQERFRYVNSAVARQFQTTPEAIIGKSLAQLFPPETAILQGAVVRHIFNTGESVSDDFAIRFPGQEMWLSTHLIPMLTPGGEVDAVMGIASDVTERRQAEEFLREKSVLSAELVEHEHLQEELRALSLHDELTGLYNRRGFMTLAEQHWRLALRTRQVFAILYLDMDDLKQINDQLGHSVGDLALQAVAQAMQHSFRDSDILARIGGDEFTILLTDCDQDTIKDGINRLEQNLILAKADESSLPTLSVSIGQASFNPDNQATFKELLAQSDADMYVHKHKSHEGRRL